MTDTTEAINPTATIGEVIKAVSLLTKTPIKDIKGKKLTRDITKSRHLAVDAVRQITGLSTRKIAKAFGLADHTTILYACEQNQIKLERDKPLIAIWQQLINDFAPDSVVAEYSGQGDLAFILPPEPTDKPTQHKRQ